jgi:phosphate-selective porin OprO/OprP
LGVKGKFAKYFNYEVVGNLPGTATIDVAFLDFAKYDQMQLRVGKFKQPYGLEQLTSSNNIDFLERSYVDQTAPGKRLGAMVFGEPKPGITYAGSIFQMNDVENDVKSEDLSFAGRGTLNFAELMGNKDAIYHVGLAGYDTSSSIRPTSSSQSSGSNTTAGTFFSYRTPGRGLSNIFRAQIQGDTLTTTGTVQSAISDATADIDTKGYGLEAIAAYNSFKVQGEYTRGDAQANYKNGTGRMSLDNEAYYAEALWLLTGEKYSGSYKKGVFSSIKPMKEFDLDNFSGLGAWELGLRYEAFDVSDSARSGSGLANGSRVQGTLNCNGTSSSSSNAASTSIAASGCKAGAHTYTAGIKWILNPNVMVKAAYSRTTYDDAWAHYDLGSSAVNGGRMKHEDIISIRSQFTF